MGRDYRKKGDTGRDAGGFVALPWAVLDSPAYARLSHPARGLLLEFARQYVRDNNGRLLASLAHLSARGWKSRDVITRAKRELIEAGFVHETVKGARPNRASWYAITWYALDKLPGYDMGAAESFVRGSYRKNASLRPSHGTESTPPRPSHGAMQAQNATPPRPSHGHHLDKPSARQRSKASKGKAKPRAAPAGRHKTEGLSAVA